MQTNQISQAENNFEAISATQQPTTGSFILNPENLSMFEQRRHQIRIKAHPHQNQNYQRRGNHSYRELNNIFDDLRDIRKNAYSISSSNQISSQQRTTMTTNTNNHGGVSISINNNGMGQSHNNIKNSQAKSLNRDYSMRLVKSSSNKNQLYLRKTEPLSRNSSVRSFAERSQSRGEILSPFYKPFEIFFNFRKKSPYISQRSHHNNTTTTVSHNKSHDIQAFNNNTNNFVNMRSQTPSFAVVSAAQSIHQDSINRAISNTIINNDHNNKIRLHSVQKQINPSPSINEHLTHSNSNKHHHVKDRSLKNYLNSHIKKSIKKRNLPQAFNTHQNKENNNEGQNERRKISRNSNIYFSTQQEQNQQLSIEKNTVKFRVEDDLNYSSDEDFERDYQVPQSVTATSAFIPAQLTSHNLSQHLLQQQKLQFQPCHSETCQPVDTYTTLLNDKSSSCKQCLIEGQRHQITRYALEKALKLSEVLMKEVQRLDQLVQNQKYTTINNPLNVIKVDSNYQCMVNDKVLQNDEQEDQEVTVGKSDDITQVKRELFEEIEKLNNIKVDFNSPQKDTLRSLYKAGKVKQAQKKIHDKKVDNHIGHGQTDGQNQNLNYLLQSSTLIADVTACVKQQENI